MLREFVERIRQGYRTMAYPDGEPVLPDRFRGRPVIVGAACLPDCRACVAACPTGAIGGTDRALTLDMGRCLFCADCAAACPEKALQFTREHRLAAWASGRIWSCETRSRRRRRRPIPSDCLSSAARSSCARSRPVGATPARRT